MERNIDFKIIGNIGHLSLSLKDVDCLKIDYRSLSDSEYELFLTYLGGFRIMFSKFAVTQSLSSRKNDIDQDCLKESIALKFHSWKTLHLPFIINHFSISRQRLWTLGEDFYVDISSYLKPIIKADIMIEGDLMEVDPKDDFQLQEFELQIEKTSFQTYKLFKENFFLNYHLLDDSIIVCSKDATTMTWQLCLCIPSYDLVEHSQILHLVNFPVSYNEYFPYGYLPSAGEQPVITFIYDKESDGQSYKTLQSNFFKKLLGRFLLSSSSCICFIGHPEGKLLYCLCEVFSKKQDIRFDNQPEVMYDIKQPIKGIHYLNELNDMKGNSSLLIVGSFGKLVFITGEKFFHNSDAFKFKNESFYVTTLYLSSTIQTYVLLKRSIFFISNNYDLWVSEFTKKETDISPKGDELKLSRNTVIMHGIVKMVLLNEQQSLFLLITKSGHLYLSECFEQETDLNLTVSLPSLMKKIMHQSSVLNNLSLLSKMHQDFFVSVSKFASLKFNGVQKLKVACSITEIDEPPKKYIININMTSTEKLDSRFWFATVYLYSFYQKDSIVISKTLPFETDQIITIEVKDSLLCPPHSSAFPLYLEIGLLMTLPETFKSEESFKLISEVLPLYIKLDTLILNESYLLKSKPDFQQNKSQQHPYSYKNALTEFCSRNLEKPIAHALHISHKMLTDCPQEFSFCLFPNISKQAVKESLVESFSKEIVQILRKRSNMANTSELHSITCRKQHISFHMSDKSDATYITLHSRSFFLLVGLRMAILELLLYNQDNSIGYGSKCVSISASVNTDCEKLSKELLSMYGQDVETEGVMEKIVSMYCQLRMISRKLPFN